MRADEWNVAYSLHSSLTLSSFDGVWCWICSADNKLFDNERLFKEFAFPFQLRLTCAHCDERAKKEEVAHVCVFVFLLRLDFIAYLHSNAYEILNDNIVVFPFLRVHKLFIALVHIYLFFRSPLPSSFSLFCSLLFAHIRFVSIRRTNSNSVEKTLK